ncbi:MAG: hypothetical protein QOH13_1084 [Thermoleophilaceae bacterium]|jgi:hypothetical protein|nr:hypothetical protein [Thermoleophilaceae bacterium]
MFESMTDRIAGTFLMGLDVAVEFATLGEFRLVDPELVAAPAPSNADAAPLMRRPDRSATTQTDRSLLPGPSTALARAIQPDETPPIRLRMPPRSTLRAVVPPARSRTRPSSPIRPPAKQAARTRGGSVHAGTQLCLFGR